MHLGNIYEILGCDSHVFVQYDTLWDSILKFLFTFIQSDVEDSKI